jgi:RecA-family ATPase
MQTRLNGQGSTGNHHSVNGNSQAASPLVLTKLGDFLAEPEEAVDWLVDRFLPSGGFSLLAAKPKVGKSTLARCLALAVAHGELFLARATAQGPVIYLALEEKRSEVRKHFQAMGATGEEEIYIHAATAPADALDKIRALIEEKKPALLIIDPLFRFTRVKDGNDYDQVTQALEPFLALARETGVHVLVVHHLGKGERTGGDAILGSTAILGAVDTSLILKRSERYRTITSEVEEVHMAVFKKQGVYWIDYYVSGRRKRERIGPDKRLAELVLRKRQVEIAEGKYLDKKRVPRCTFNELAALYLPWAQTNHRSYVATKSRVALLCQAVGELQLSEMTPLLVDGYISQRAAKLKPVTVNRGRLAAYVRQSDRLGKSPDQSRGTRQAAPGR